jgi:hypothetical protein
MLPVEQYQFAAANRPRDTRLSELWRSIRREQAPKSDGMPKDLPNRKFCVTFWATPSIPCRTAPPVIVAWNNGVIAKLALTIYVERAFDCLPIWPMPWKMPATPTLTS